MEAAFGGDALDRVCDAFCDWADGVLGASFLHV